MVIVKRSVEHRSKRAKIWEKIRREGVGKGSPLANYVHRGVMLKEHPNLYEGMYGKKQDLVYKKQIVLRLSKR